MHYNSVLWYSPIFFKEGSQRKCFVKKGVLWNLAKFTGKHPCWNLIFNKVAGLKLNFEEHLSNRTPSGDCSFFPGNNSENQKKPIFLWSSLLQTGPLSIALLPKLLYQKIFNWCVTNFAFFNFSKKKMLTNILKFENKYFFMWQIRTISSALVWI